MSKILSNNSGSSVTINDTGQVIANSSSYTIDPAQYDLYANSTDVITLLASGTLTYSDGSNTLSLGDAINHLRGVLPETPLDVNVSRVVRTKIAFTLTSELNTIDTNTEKDYIYFKNPSDSGKDVLITHFITGVDSSNVRSITRFYADPTVSANGTALSIINTYIGGSLPTSAMVAYKFPTVTSKGNILNMVIGPADSPSRGINRYYWVEPGHSLLITIENSVSNAKTFADVYWLEGL